MSDHAESFRNSFISQLASIIQQDQLSAVLHAFDAASTGYEISRKPVEVIVTDSVPEVVKYYIASKAIAHCSISTLSQYRYKLIKFFEAVKKPFLDITSTDIRMYLFQYKSANSVSDHTLENTRRCLNSFFEWLVDNEYIVRNPCAKIEHIKYQEPQREPLSPYDLEVLRWHCETIREKALVDFLFSTGCRVSECSAMNKSDICWEDRSVIIHHGKGDKRRIVFFNAESELTLRKYIESRTDDDPALFVRIRAPHSRLSARAIELEMQRISQRSSLTVYPHKLRHTFATAGLSGGMPLEKLQALMGHSNPKTTLIYAKNNVNDLKHDHNRIFN